MDRLNWVDRKFHFDIPPGWIFNVTARLSGTAARLHELTSGLTEARLLHKPDGKWSIKEHIGHLLDLEALHEGRIDDFKNRKHTLRAADMKNVATEQADHNNRKLGELMGAFARRRQDFINKLLVLDDETQTFVSHHPRLQIPMKPVDMASFTAEHDDHHIASIIEIINELEVAG